MDETASTVYSDGENFNEDSTFETSLEILYVNESDVDAIETQENIIDVQNDRNIVGKDLILTISEDTNEKEEDSEHQYDEDLDQQLQNAAQNLEEELNKAAQVIKEEMEIIEKELQSYKELREIFDKLSNECDKSGLFKPKSLSQQQDINKKCRQDENSHYTLSTSPTSWKYPAKLPMPAMSPMNPWFYSKCLLDAEKFCNQQMERVRRCISVSSLNSHIVDMKLDNSSKHAEEHLLDIANQDIMEESIKRYADISINWNLNQFSWRQPQNSKHFNERVLGTLERGGGGDVNNAYCIRPTTGSTMIDQII